MDKRGIIDGVAKNSTSAGAAAAAGGGGGDCGDNDGNVEKLRGGGGAGGGVERRLLFGEDEKDDDDSPATKKSRTGGKKTTIPQARGGGGGGEKGSRRRNPAGGDGTAGQQHDIGLPEEIFVFQGGGKNDTNDDHDGGDGGGGGGRGEGGGHNNNDDDDEVRSLDGDDDLPQEREINLDPQEFLQTSLSRVMDEACSTKKKKKKKDKSTSLGRTGTTTTTTTSSSSSSSRPSSSSSVSLHDPIELHKVIDTITSLDERWKQYVSALLTNLEHQRHEEVRMVTEIAVENEERALSLQNDLDEERQRSSELTVALGENEQRMEILHHELNQERSNHLSLLNQQIDEMAEMKVTFASERHKLVEEHETELEQTKMTMQKEMESILLESIDMELTGVVNRHENETDIIIKEYEMKLHDAQGEIVRLKRKSVDDMKRLRRGLVKRYEDEKNRIVERHVDEMEEMKKSMSIMSLKKNKSSSGSTSREMVSYEEEKKEEHSSSTAIIQNGGEEEEYVIRSLREQLRCRDEKHRTEMERLRTKLQMEADVTLEKLMAQHEKETACRALLDAEREEEVVQEHRIELKKTKADLERSLRMEFDVTKQELISRQDEDREELILAHETELDDMRESLEEQFRFEWEHVEVLPKDSVLVPAHYVYAFAAACTLYTLFK